MDLEILKEARDIACQIQDSDIQSYILKHQKKTAPHLLRLIADQWIARQKAKYKLPTWFANKEIIYPAPLSVEQSSSEITANYKARLFANSEHTKLIDLTGGMGVDTTAFAKRHKKVVYVEKNYALIPIARHNFEVLGYDNIDLRHDDAISFLSNNHVATGVHCYIDPARRDSSKNKVFKIEDCEPDILSIKHLMDNFVIKYSPILDIKLAIEQLGNVTEIHIVAVENEVKELLFLNQKNTEDKIIKCVNFLSDGTHHTFGFTYEQEQQLSVPFTMPKQYIYEPNAAILKAGAFKSVAQKYSLEKLAANSHIYSSDELKTNFPGRSFICEAVCKFDKKEILSKLSGSQANVSTRNFPMKPDEIKKRLGLKDGGDTYLFATENYLQQKIVLICRKAPIIN